MKSVWLFCAILAALPLYALPAATGQDETPGIMGRPRNPPTDAAPGREYVGQPVCAQCHPDEAEDYEEAPMAHTLWRGPESPTLRSNADMAFQAGQYSYQITRQGSEFMYRVGDRQGAISKPILWAFGSGKSAVTFVFQDRGTYYESRVSFFNSIRGLDYTTGAPLPRTKSLIEVAGVEMNPTRVRNCFGCHSTGAVKGSQLQLDQLTPGITCEACHGPGGEHVAAIQEGKIEKARTQIFNPGRLNTEEEFEFCGSCHISFRRAIESGVQGIENVRFQPYRLANSRCYDPIDRRINCAACHNPHKKIDQTLKSYDSSCFRCHPSASQPPSSGTHALPACPVGTRDCVTCHMPKYELPGAHREFTDHWIRVVHPNEAYPD